MGSGGQGTVNLEVISIGLAQPSHRVLRLDETTRGDCGSMWGQGVRVLGEGQVTPAFCLDYLVLRWEHKRRLV